MINFSNKIKEFRVSSTWRRIKKVTTIIVYLYAIYMYLFSDSDYIYTHPNYDIKVRGNVHKFGGVFTNQVHYLNKKDYDLGITKDTSWEHGPCIISIQPQYGTRNFLIIRGLLNERISDHILIADTLIF